MVLTQVVTPLDGEYVITEKDLCLAMELMYKVIAELEERDIRVDAMQGSSTLISVLGWYIVMQREISNDTRH